jgi:hypothetical protein
MVAFVLFEAAMRNRMRAGRALICCCLALAACRVSPDGRFVSEVRSDRAGGRSFAGMSNGQLIARGRATCNALDSGTPFDDVFEQAVVSGTPRMAEIALMKAADDAYCPLQQVPDASVGTVPPG